MVLQVSCGLDSKISEESYLRAITSELGSILHGLAKQKECEIEEGHLMTDHVHMLISIPPKFAVAQVVGFIKGKSAIQIARQFCGKKRNYNTPTLVLPGMYLALVDIGLMFRILFQNKPKLENNIQAKYRITIYVPSKT